MQTAPPRSELAVSVLALAAGLAGCPPRLSAQVGTTVRDSAGIRIVESWTATRSENAIWTVDSVPAVEFGAPPHAGGETSADVAGVRVLGGFRVAVVRADADYVSVFDSLGNLVRTVGGRRGAAAGALNRVSGLYRCVGDTLVVNEVTRVSVFDSQGRFLRNGSPAWSTIDGVLRTQGVPSARCSVLLVVSLPRTVPPSSRPGVLSYTLFWTNLDGTTSDTIATFPAREVVGRVISGMNQPVPIPWGTEAKWALGPDRVYLGLSDRPEIRAFDVEGRLVQIIRWANQPDPVTEVDRQLYRERRYRSLHNHPELESLQDIIPELDEFPYVPRKKPLFLSLLADDEGNLWVRRYPVTVAGRPELYDWGRFLHEPAPSSQPQEEWTVFGAAGQLLGTVRVPGNLAVRAIHEDYVVAVWKDQSNIERVRLYRLQK